ncbi:acyl-CoA synthetase [Cupriavidus necator]|uniref:acyl-CoA synthetase n=1 Tax=Cupriavidus necator TaxID=106590 RepID=UPI0007352B3E|nr:acyl-CoA synthetase [Cupriavidus necator]KUE87063.1 acyl-CoA synthetase [Cupriavidus necator]
MSVIEQFARATPDRVAYRMVPSGQAVTWAELEQRSRQCAAALLAAGLREGDGIAVLLENHVRYFEILWAAHRIGLYYTTISRHLKADEVEYIVQDCGARVLFCSAQTLGDLAPGALAPLRVTRVLLDGSEPGYSNYEAWLEQMPADVTLPRTVEGTDFSYSSGTTGRPKGIKRPLQGANAFFRTGDDARLGWKSLDRDTVYLSTAPFYHTAPVRWNMATMRAGGTSVMMEKFEPLAALDAIARYGVTHSQWVPTMFVRLLRLTAAERERFDLSTMRYAIHAAAPCPISVKQQMIDWWGPILYEFYSGTELVGRTSLDSVEWLAHKGSVGRPEFGQVHIVGDDGNEVPQGQTGVVYFSGGGTFAYHNDPEKTRQVYNDRGWATYGDVGYVDADGFLYLTDRLANTIVSGGVNIYPQESENVLMSHPAVFDVAVVGVPNTEFGEEVKAVVQLHEPERASPVLAEELIALCRSRISPIKCPRSVDFVAALPRTETGKLLKRAVKASYWPTENRIAH